MVRFSIYKKSDKFKIDPNLLVLSLFIIAFVAFHINRNANLKNEETIEKVIAYFALVIVGISFLRKMFYLHKPEKLHGKLEGFLEFKNESILIGEEKIQLSEIQRLEIYNGDYYGREISHRKGVTSSMSNGVDNYLNITKKDGSTQTVMFELYNEFDMGKIQDILIGYHIKGKMTFDNLIQVLKFSKREASQMKEFLKVATSSNSGYTQ